MAESTKEVVYYKGKKYHVSEILNNLTRLVDTTNKTVTLLVQSELILREEEFNNKPKTFGYVNWTK